MCLYPSQSFQGVGPCVAVWLCPHIGIYFRATKKKFIALEVTRQKRSIFFWTRTSEELETVSVCICDATASEFHVKRGTEPWEEKDSFPGSQMSNSQAVELTHSAPPHPPSWCACIVSDFCFCRFWCQKTNNKIACMWSLEAVFYQSFWLRLNRSDPIVLSAGRQKTSCFKIHIVWKQADRFWLNNKLITYFK